MKKKLKSQSKQSSLCLLTDNQSNIHGSEHTNITLPAHFLAKHCGSLHYRGPLFTLSHLYFWSHREFFIYVLSHPLLSLAFKFPIKSISLITPHPSLQHLQAGHSERLSLAFSDITPSICDQYLFSNSYTRQLPHQPEWGTLGDSGFPFACYLETMGRREIALRINYLIGYHIVLSILLIVFCKDIILIHEQETDVNYISTALWTASPRIRVQIASSSFSIPQGAIPWCLSFKG